MAYINFENILANNWNPDYHKSGQPIPMNALMFGLIILDWDGSFRKRIKKYGTTDLKLPFQYLEEGNIPSWSKGANWNEVGDIMGRFEPMSIYSNSNAQTFSLGLKYHAEALRAGSDVNTPWTLEWIEQLVKRYQSLVFPAYDGNYSPPPKLLFNIGNIYRDVPIVVTNVSVDHMPPFDVTTGLPKTRKITLDCRVSYPTWQALSGAKIWSAYEGGAGQYGPEVFAFESLDEKYRPKNKRSLQKSGFFESPF